MPPRHTPQRMEVDIIQAVPSDTDQMASLWVETLEVENSKLTQLVYAGADMFAQRWLRNIISAHVDSKDNRFAICYNLDLTNTYEEGTEPGIEEEENLTHGWISVGIVPGAKPDFNSYAVNDFSAYVGWKLVAREARARGEHLSIENPRFRLVCEIVNWSIDGQARNFDGAHLVVNALVLWDSVCYPEGHEDQTSELASKLLGWVISDAERRNVPIWTQFTVNHMEPFRQAGFREVAAFTLNLNNYAPRGSIRNWEWVQMVCRTREGTRARSSSRRNGGGRRRRPSF